MSLLLRSVLIRSRWAFQRAFGVRKPCLLKRLGSSGEVLTSLVRSASNASSFRVATQPQFEPQTLKKCATEDDTDLVQPVSGGVLFASREANYYHQVMENSPLYKDTIFKRSDLQALRCEVSSDISIFLKREDWNDASTGDIVNAFRFMTSYALENGLVISNPMFDAVCTAIGTRHMEFTDDEMLEIGKLNTLWRFPESVHDRNYKLIYVSFDKFCVQRYQKEWYASRNMTNILQTADIFYWQRTGQRSHYLRCMIFHLGLKVKEPHHLIQIMYYLGTMRSVPASYKFYDLEKRVFSFSENYSIAELAIVVNSLFRTKSRMQYYPLIQDLLIKSLKGFSTLDDYLMVTICKSFSNMPLELKPLLVLFQKRLITRLNEFRMETLVHTLWMVGSNNIADDDFLQIIYEKTLENITELRVKELTRVIATLTEFTSPNRDLRKLANYVFKELQKPEKAEWFTRKAFIQGATLHRLLICGVCPTEFLNLYLTSVEHPQTSNEALGVDVHLEVFYPNYKGARLNSQLREEIFNYRFGSSSSKFVRSCGAEGFRSTFNSQSIESAKDVVLDVLDGKDDHMLVKRIVPSFGYLDVLLRISKDGIYLPIPKEMKEIEPWKLTRIPLESTQVGDKFLSIMFVPSSQEFIKRKITFFQRERIAILRKLGYIPLEVGVEYWRNNTNSANKKTDLLKQIAQALSDNES